MMESDKPICKTIGRHSYRSLYAHSPQGLAKAGKIRICERRPSWTWARRLYIPCKQPWSIERTPCQESRITRVGYTPIYDHRKHAIFEWGSIVRSNLTSSSDGAAILTRLPSPPGLRAAAYWTAKPSLLVRRMACS